MLVDKSKMFGNELENNNTPSILLVDDNQINLFVIAKVFEQCGVVAECVRSGADCIEKAGKKKYDLIVMDHMMPEMDGVETLKRLKENPDFCTPVIVLTANYGPDLEILYREAGFAEYMIKPANAVTVRELLQRYIKKDGITRLDNILDDNGGALSRKVLRLKEFGFDEIEELVADGVTEEEYEELLRIFKNESVLKLADCEEYFRKKDLANYAIIVHGLKNDAAMINDISLSKIALKHEMESKGGNLEFVKENWPGLREKWQHTINRIEKYFE